MAVVTITNFFPLLPTFLPRIRLVYRHSTKIQLFPTFLALQFVGDRFSIGKSGSSCLLAHSLSIALQNSDLLYLTDAAISENPKKASFH
jgi:hypothetical protein